MTGRLALLLLCLLVPAPALAASEGGGAMTLFWHAVNLIILISVLVWAARTPIRTFFRERHLLVKDDLDAAATVLNESESRLAEWKNRVEQLDAEIETIKQRARERAEAESAHILAEAEAAAQRIRSDAQAAVSQEVSRARTVLRNEAADLATQLATDMLHSSIGADDQKRLVSEFVERIESSGQSGSGSN